MGLSRELVSSIGTVAALFYLGYNIAMSNKKRNVVTDSMEQIIVTESPGNVVADSIIVTEPLSNVVISNIVDSMDQIIVDESPSTDATDNILIEIPRNVVTNSSENIMVTKSPESPWPRNGTNQTIVATDWIQVAAVSYGELGDGTCGENPSLEALRRVLGRWRELAAGRGIPYFLTCGSLIGAVRGGQIMPWDKDIDVMFDDRFNNILASMADKRDFRPDVNDASFRLIIQKDFAEPPHNNRHHRRRFDCKGKEVKENLDECSFQEPFGRLISGEVHVELYDYRLLDGSKVYDPTEEGRIHALDLVFPVRPCSLGGLEVMCPNKPVQFLRSLWYEGDAREPDKICQHGLWINRT